MQDVVGLFGSKGDGLQAVEALYELGYGDTEIGFLDRRPGDAPADAAVSLDTLDMGENSSVARAKTFENGKTFEGVGVASAILGSGPDDEIGSLYREGAESGSAVVTVSILEGDEAEVTRILYASGALKVNSYRADTGWME